MAVIILLFAGCNKPEPFHVIAFYTGKHDPAHVSFVREANKWFPKMARQNGFTYEATDDWTKLNEAFLANYQIVIFLTAVRRNPLSVQISSSLWKTAAAGWDFIFRLLL